VGRRWSRLADGEEKFGPGTIEYCPRRGNRRKERALNSFLENFIYRYLRFVNANRLKSRNREGCFFAFGAGRDG
jgi:hypothetical protein